MFDCLFSFLFIFNNSLTHMLDFWRARFLCNRCYNSEDKHGGDQLNFARRRHVAGCTSVKNLHLASYPLS